METTKPSSTTACKKVRTEVTEADNDSNHHYGGFIWLRITADAGKAAGSPSSQRVQ